MSVVCSLIWVAHKIATPAIHTSATTANWINCSFANYDNRTNARLHYAIRMAVKQYRVHRLWSILPVLLSLSPFLPIHPSCTLVVASLVDDTYLLTSYESTWLLRNKTVAYSMRHIEPWKFFRRFTIKRGRARPNLCFFCFLFSILDVK